MFNFDANDIISSIAWLNELAQKTDNENSEEYIVAFSENTDGEIWFRRNKVVYDDRKPISEESDCSRYPIFIDPYSYYDRNTTGVRGTFKAVVCTLDREDEEYFSPYIEIELDGIDEYSIVVENGKWYAS